MLKVLLVFFIFVAALYILWWLASAYDDSDYRRSPHYKPAPYVPDNTTKTATATSSVTSVGTTVSPTEKETWSFPGRRVVSLLPGERTHPPAACLFGKGEEGDFILEGEEEPEFLTAIEANYWHNKMNHSADQVIEITTKRSKYGQTGLLK